MKSLFYQTVKFIFVAVAFFLFTTASVFATSKTLDFDGDGKDDVSVFRPSDGYWYIQKSSGGFSSLQWGLSTDLPVPGDYDGDGKADLAVFRRTPFTTLTKNNAWYILRSSDNVFREIIWIPNSPWWYYDIADPADYDGDRKTDVAVFRRSDAIGDAASFMVLQSSTGSGIDARWGSSGLDKSVSADYDGDGKTDLAVYRGNASGTLVNAWFILQSSNGVVRVERFGLPTDRHIPADYDGDGKADIAVWRPSNGFWYRINSSDNSFSSIQFGLPSDKPTPADYDGDGKTDVAVFRPSNGVWYLQRSTEGLTAQRFGLQDDIPLPNLFVR